MRKKKAEQLNELLNRCRDLVAASDDSAWSHISKESALETLDRAIESRPVFKSLHYGRLQYLFLPTGPLQEISIDNGWADEYLELAASFDRLIGI